MAKFTWEKDGCAGGCWVVYENAPAFSGAMKNLPLGQPPPWQRTAVLTIWFHPGMRKGCGTARIEFTGRPQYREHRAVAALLETTIALGGEITDSLMDAVCVTLEISDGN